MTAPVEVSGVVVARVLATEHGLAYGERRGIWYVGERDVLLRMKVQAVIVPKTSRLPDVLAFDAEVTAS